MRTGTAVVILGGGIAALWAIASSSSAKSPGSEPIAPGSTVTKDDVNASILKTLAEIEAKKKGG